MSDFDKKLQNLLSEEDKAFISDRLEETGYYEEIFASFRGRGSGLRIAVWVAVLVASALIFYSIWMFFHVDSIRAQIMYASLAIMANSAQIAFQHWLNQRLNRKAIMMEIHRLRMELAK